MAWAQPFRVSPVHWQIRFAVDGLGNLTFNGHLMKYHTHPLNESHDPCRTALNFFPARPATGFPNAMKRWAATKWSALAAVALSTGVAQGAAYIWTGASNGNWDNGLNYSGGVAHPNDSSGDYLDFAAKGAGANNNMALEGDRRTGGIAIRDSWQININGRTLRADWVSVDYAVGNGTGIITGGGNFQSYNSFSWNAAPGDTLIVNSYYKPVGSNNRNNSFNDGGTIITNNSIDHDNKVMNYSVTGTTTVINNHWWASSSSGSITVASGARYAGDGSTNVATTTIDGTVSPSDGGNADSGIGTLSFGTTLTLNGTFDFDLNTLGNSDRIAAAALILGSGSTLTFDTLSSFTPNATYKIATYSSLSGVFGTLNLPSGWLVDYDGDLANPNSILLTTVPEPCCLSLLGLVSVGLVARRRRM